jgi:hypothetical protein
VYFNIGDTNYHMQRVLSAPRQDQTAMASLVLWIVLNNPPVGRLANNPRHAEPSFSAPRNKMLRGDIVARQQLAANLGHQFL